MNGILCKYDEYERHMWVESNTRRIPAIFTRSVPRGTYGIVTSPFLDTTCTFQRDSYSCIFTFSHNTDWTIPMQRDIWHGVKFLKESTTTICMTQIMLILFSMCPLTFFHMRRLEKCWFVQDQKLENVKVVQCNGFRFFTKLRRL